MKKFISAILSIAMVLSCVSISVQAEETETVTVTSSKYAIDTASKKISGVAPLTKVSAFESTFSGATVNVVNVDGSSMDDNAYATENVFVNIDGKLYKIDVEYPYDPIHTIGRNNRADGDILFEKASANFNSTVDGQAVFLPSGFAYATSGYKLGYEGGSYAAVTSDHKTVITKQSENGQPVYVIENNAPRYAFLRSHYSSASYESQAQSELTNITKGKYSVTTVSFKTDKMGNFSLHHNAAGYATAFKGDAALERFTYNGNAKYIPNAIHFTEDGKVKIGGTYSNGEDVTDRSAAHTTSATWEAGKEYTVSVVQKLNDGGSRYGYVYGVYLDGVKIFPMGNEAKDSSGHFAYQSSKGAYSMTTRGDDYKYYGGISAVLVGAAPVNGDNIKLTLSDVKVYTVGAPADYTGNIDKDLTLANATDVEVDNSASSIDVSTEETVASLRAKYTDYAISVYNAGGTQPESSANLETGMSARFVSKDGLQSKLYSITATSRYNQTEPESTVYTVDTAAKTISNVPLFTTVGTFLGNFANGPIMQVVNIDGSAMANDAYATEYVSLKAPNGDLYKINVKYAYSPIQTNGASLSDNASLYNFTANAIGAGGTTAGGFAKVQAFAKIGYGSGNAGPSNTADQTVKGTKKTENGETVYVMENDSNNYAYLRSHYTESSQWSTELNTSTSSSTLTPVITTVEFEADKYGNISVFNNVPIRKTDDTLVKGDGILSTILYTSGIAYAPTSVHFLEDGSVKLGGTYDNNTAAQRAPAQVTGLTWEPGKKYTVSIAQRYVRKGRDAYVDGVYVNGIKIFPNSNTADGDANVKLQSDGSYLIKSRSNDLAYGGGLSSIMIGTAPKTSGENLTVSVSDVKVYTTAYNPAKDAQITIESNNGAISVDNGKAVISAMKAVDVADFTSDAKLKLENGYLKAVSADGLAMKTYKIVQEDIRTQFLNGENGPAITGLATAGNSICFMADVQDASLLDGVTPVVILGAYDKDTFKLLNCVIATGTAFTNEITRYKGVLNISEYNKEDIVLRGFVWDGFTNMDPLTSVSELK